MTAGSDRARLPVTIIAGFLGSGKTTLLNHINKCDLASAARLSSIEDKIRAMKAGARIVRTIRCQVPLPLILSVGSSESDRYASDHIDCDHEHLTNDGFEAFSFEAERPFTADSFNAFEWLSDNVFHAKGVLWIAESEKRHVFHLAGQRFTLDESRCLGPMRNRLVLIGRNLDTQRLRDQLEGCLWRLNDHKPLSSPPQGRRGRVARWGEPRVPNSGATRLTLPSLRDGPLPLRPEGRRG